VEDLAGLAEIVGPIGVLVVACPPHHWQIVEANGPTSEGQCIKCSEMRTFANSQPDKDYNRFLSTKGIASARED
jgi:hypothetical protein